MLRRFLAKFYGQNLDRAISLWVEEMQASRE